jgi:spore maturation protein CgeB
MTPPRIAIYYYVIKATNFRNDGPPLFMNYNLRKILNGDTAMEDQTRNVIHLHPNGNTQQFGNYDLHLLVDHGEDGLGMPLDFEYPHPNAYWISDAHLGYEHRLETAKKFDYVFCAQRWFIDKLEKDGVDRRKLYYLPHAFEPDVYRPLALMPKYDWAFIGHINSKNRLELLHQFCLELPNYYLGTRMPGVPGYNVFDDANEKFNSSKLILNDAVGDDVNMRVFEVLGSGRPLLTLDLPELRELFKPDEHLAAFRTVPEALDLATALLLDDTRRERLALNGYTEAINKHTYNHRARKILETCLYYVPTAKESDNAHPVSVAP